MNLIKSNIKNRADKFYYIIWGVISLFVPVVSWLLGLKLLGTKVFKGIIIVSCTMFGLTMYVDDPIYDSSRYKEFFYDVVAFKGGLFSFISYLFNNGNIDFYQGLSSYFISFFTTKYEFYFAFLGLIYGIFLSLNVYIIFSSEYVSKKNKVLFYFFGIVFLFLQPIWYIEGARFWTASQIYIYIVLSFFLLNKKKWLLLFLIPLIHSSFLFPVLFFIVFILIKKYLKNRLFLFFSFSLFVSSFFIKNLNVSDVFTNFLSSISGNLAYRLLYYNSSEYKDVLKAQERTAIGLFFEICEKILYFYTFTLLFFFKSKFQKESKIRYDFYLFSFYFFSIASLLAIIPIFDRFLEVSYYLVLINICFIIFKNKSISLRFLFVCLFVLLFLLILNNFLQAKHVFSIKFLFPIFSLFETLIT